MKKITEIYSEYKIQRTLENHMLRVAAVASIICDNYSESLPKEDIILACLLHDMGNIIKFQLDYFPEFNKPEGLEYWQKVQDEYIRKYGKDEHSATIQIMEELNLPKSIIFIVEQISPLLVCAHRDSNDINAKIVIYADNRVDPHGVVSYDERMNEGAKRYKNRKGILSDDERKKMIACGKEIEKQIFSKCKIKPEDINDETTKPIISGLRDFMLN
jgi:HD superfamily phosphodiesterase